MFLCSGNSLRPFPTSLPYLLVPFLPLLYEIDCAPLLSADAAVIEKHTLLRPFSPSLPDSHWLPVRGDITLLLWLLPSLLLCSLPRSLFTSLSVDSDHSFIAPPLLLPVLYLFPLSSSSSLYTVWISRSSCSYIQPCSGKHNNAYCTLA